MEFLRQKYWNGLPFPSPGDLPDPGIEPMSPEFAGRFFITEQPGSPASSMLGFVYISCWKNTARANQEEGTLSLSACCFPFGHLWFRVWGCGCVHLNGLQFNFGLHSPTNFSPLHSRLLLQFSCVGNPLKGSLPQEGCTPWPFLKGFNLRLAGRSSPLRCFIFHSPNGTPLQYCCPENPMDGGAWWAAVHGVAKGRTQLSDFAFTFHFHALEKEMATHSSVLAWRIPWTEKPGRLQSMG